MDQKSGVGPLAVALNFVSNFSSLTYQNKEKRSWIRGTEVLETVTGHLPFVTSCIRLSLAELNVQGPRRSEVSLNLRHLSIQHCSFDNVNTLNKLIQSCPKLESCVLRNNRHYELSGKMLPISGIKLPGTIRTLEVDRLSSLEMSSSNDVAVHPHLATCIMDLDHPRIEEFVQANPTIITLGVPSGVDLVQVANGAPQIRSLKVSNPKHAILLSNSDGLDGLGHFPHLEELRIHLYDTVPIDQFEQMIRPVDGFHRPQNGNFSQLEKLTIGLSAKACGDGELCMENQTRQWRECLEEKGYLDRAVVKRSEELWTFSWSRTPLAVSRFSDG
ncbi:hypothetical protein CPB86DRAFT_117159 [Serendipita vermifera]|nr:hypothetical protein CPB86DRAFT_117159 [Serendipita vermifera]